MSLPWKNSHPTLPDNYLLCKKWMSGLLKRLRQNPTLFAEYNTVIRDQLEKGIIEVCQIEHQPMPTKSTTYLTMA